MSRLVSLSAIFVAAILLAGCDEFSSNTPSSQPNTFGPTAMRVHPIFTQITDLHHSGKPDGVEAQLEFTDQFGDPTKANGQVLFELFDYRKTSPDPRGKRFGYWVGKLTTLDEQRDRWNTTLRTYRFELDYTKISSTQSYVLTATFEQSTGGRFFNSIVLQGHTPEKSTTKPASPLGIE